MFESASKVLLLFAASAAVMVQADHVTFEDVSTRLGPFEYGQIRHLTEQRDSAVAGMVWFDYDNDGDQDLFICTASTKSNALFQNDGNGGFTDVTAAAGLVSNAPCIGLIAVDLDNDGHLDLFVGPEFFLPTGLLVYKNNGDGTFSDLTSSAGFPALPGGLGMAAADYDGDGYVDIFVPQITGDDILLKNNGDFTFTDVAAAAGVVGEVILTPCEAVFADFNGDNLPDLVVAQCISPPKPTFLYLNNGDGTFAAPYEISAPNLGMAVAVGDIDHDGDLDIFIGSSGRGGFDQGITTRVLHNLLINNGDGTFEETILTSGIPNNDFGWSAAMIDFDNDRNLDLIYMGSGVFPWFVNFNKGRLLFGDGTGSFEHATQCGPDDCTPCAPSGPVPPFGVEAMQPNLCFTEGFGCDYRDMNTGLWSGPFESCNNIAQLNCDGCYRESVCAKQTAAEAACVPALGVETTGSRTATIATADFDGDGFDDMAIMSADYSIDYGTNFQTEQLLAPGAITNIILLKNNAESGYNWIRVKTIGISGNRNGVGSMLKVDDGSVVQYQAVRAITSPMLNAQEWISFGLAMEEHASVIVTWSVSGNQEKFCVDANTRTELVEGDGRSVNAACPFEDRGNGGGSGSDGSAGTSSGGNGGMNGNSNGGSMNGIL